MFKYQSGRVIALGRAMLAVLFLLSIWLDRSQQTSRRRPTALLLLYMLSRSSWRSLTWRNWWLDARLADPRALRRHGGVHGDRFLDQRLHQPVLPLLHAAVAFGRIRWGWRETTLTATALVLLYLCAGLLVAGKQAFELQRFIVRSGHLLILSAVLIWFGIHQQFTRLFFDVDDLDRRLSRDDDALPQALDVAIEAAGRARGRCC